jgi:hypothetical protein
MSDCREKLRKAKNYRDSNKGFGSPVLFEAHTPSNPALMASIVSGTLFIGTNLVVSFGTN